jgi:hypothetical protein
MKAVPGDERTGKLEIWENWLTKDGRVFAGRYELKDGKLTLKGVFAGSGGGSQHRSGKTWLTEQNVRTGGPGTAFILALA